MNVVPFPVKIKIKIEIKCDLQKCPSHTSDKGAKSARRLGRWRNLSDTAFLVYTPQNSL